MSNTAIIKSTLQNEQLCFQISSGTVTVVFATYYGPPDTVENTNEDDGS